ncbi:MAG: hypothetical protein ACRDN9_06125 [Streptosporangiaceae bacterium]
MEFTLVNPQVKYQRVPLIDPPETGYIHVAAAVEPPRQPGPPFPGRSAEKKALLGRLKSLARQLESLDTVEKATVYRAVVVPPVRVPAGKKAARYDVAVLVETTSPDVVDEVRAAEPYKLLIEALTEAAKDTHVMTARCPKRVADVDKTRQGMFLFNYFAADDSEVALDVWDYLAGWYAVETDMDNSTLLQPIGEADYVLVNHARWDSLPAFMVRQFAKKSFRTYVLANLKANRTVSMPILYRLA